MATKKKVLETQAKKPQPVAKKATAKKPQPVAKKATAKKATAKKATAKKATAKKATAKKATAKPQAQVVAGSRAPDFELPDQDGDLVTSQKLAGAPYVLYFYPKDDTPGCTTEACDFRDSLSAFKRAGARVLGVSPDSSASHARFAKKHRLPFTLLSDPNRDLATAYGVWVQKRLYGREYMGIERSTFVVGADGLVRRVWRGVKVPGHATAVLAAVRERG